MSASQIGEAIVTQLHRHTADFFNAIGHSVKVEEYAVDFARYNTSGLESTFYVNSIENVVRKDFNEIASGLIRNNPRIKEFKVKYKRPEKNVRFYIKVESVNNTNESTVS